MVQTFDTSAKLLQSLLLKGYSHILYSRLDSTGGSPPLSNAKNKDSYYTPYHYFTHPPAR